MMTNPSSPRGDVENAVLQLQQQLNSNYLAAEKLMSLRNPDESKLRDLSANIDLAYKNLTEIIEQAPTHETSNLLERASKNKIEFDTYLSEFMQKQPLTSNYDDKSCSSIGKRSTVATSTTSKSSRRSVKSIAAEAEYRAAKLKAKLKAKQAIERTEEETLIAKDEARLAMQKSQIARREAERELEVASVKLSVWKESAVSNLPLSQHLHPIQPLLPSQYLSPIQPLLPSQHLPAPEIVPTFLTTSPHEAEQSQTFLKTVTAGEYVSNICVSTICNSVNVNNVKPSVTSSTFAVKPVTNSVKFYDIVNEPNVAEPLCSNIYSSNKSKNEPVYST